jgi:hypothetical protein
MSQLPLDEELDLLVVLPPLQRWTTAQSLRGLRRGEHVLDDRVPEILLTLNRPTFVTIDPGFWHRRLCHPGYCIVYFALRDRQQPLLPDLLRALFRLSEFRTRNLRMGKVARVSQVQIDFWEFQKPGRTRLTWTGSS